MPTTATISGWTPLDIVPWPAAYYRVALDSPAVADTTVNLSSAGVACTFRARDAGAPIITSVTIPAGRTYAEFLPIPSTAGPGFITGASPGLTVVSRAVVARGIAFRPPGDLSAASIAFNTDGTISGTVPIADVVGLDTTGNARSVAITGGLLTFTSGPAYATAGGYVYNVAPFGSITVAGTLAGGPGHETLFSMPFGHGQLGLLQGGVCSCESVPMIDNATLASSVSGIFGGGLGLFPIRFTGAPGSPCTLTYASAIVLN